MQTSLKMARMSVADGVKVIACTPHIVPGLYDNSGPDIRRRVQWLQYELDAPGSPVVSFPDAMRTSRQILSAS